LEFIEVRAESVRSAEELRQVERLDLEAEVADAPEFRRVAFGPPIGWDEVESVGDEPKSTAIG
jgi:hypothetical protein